MGELGFGEVGFFSVPCKCIPLLNYLPLVQSGKKLCPELMPQRALQLSVSKAYQLKAAAAFPSLGPPWKKFFPGLQIPESKEGLAFCLLLGYSLEASGTESFAPFPWPSTLRVLIC